MKPMDSGAKGRFWKKHLPEIILSLAVALSATIGILVVSLNQAKGPLMATVYRQGETVLRLDLNVENNPRDIEIQGTKTMVVLEVKKNAIRVKESGCPSQFCVHQSWQSASARPLVCAYNGIAVVLSQANPTEVIVG